MDEATRKIEPISSLADIPAIAPSVGRGEITARSIGVDETPKGSTTPGTTTAPRWSLRNPWITGVIGSATVAGAWLWWPRRTRA